MNLRDFENLIADAKAMNPTFKISVDDSGDDWLVNVSFESVENPFAYAVLCTEESAYNTVHKLLLIALRELSKPGRQCSN